MRTSEQYLGHVGPTGWAEQQARSERPLEMPMYDEGIEVPPMTTEERVSFALRSQFAKCVEVDKGDDAA